MRDLHMDQMIQASFIELDLPHSLYYKGPTPELIGLLSSY